MKIKEIAEKFNTDELLAKILYSRGYKNEMDINYFLNGDINDLHAPNLFEYIDKVRDKIVTSADFEDNITIWTDYDVDGITSGVILYKVLKDKLNANVNCYVGNRYTDGYGLSKQGIDYCLKEYNTDLFISVDCGISNVEEVEYIKENGSDIVVIDHHENKGEKPDCFYIDAKVNESYPFKKLCGCGVTWKVCQFLTNDKLTEYIDIVALATIADVVDLVGENRIIVKEGLKRIRRGKVNVGLKALIEAKDIECKDVSVGHVGFSIAPCINALGRLEKADKAFKLFLSSKKKAIEIANYLVGINEKRKLDTRIGINEVEEGVDLSKNIIVAKGSFKSGITGVIAGKLKDKYKLPTVIIGQNNKGSCRSISPLNIYKILKKNERFLEKFGGHKMAAGFTLKEKCFEQFKESLESYTDSFEYDTVNYDVVISTKDLSKRKVKNLKRLKPFGKGNPKPRLKSICKVHKVKVVGDNNKHLKFILDNDIKGIGFNLKNKLKECQFQDLVVIYTPEIDDYYQEQIQLNVKDIKGIK
ncbi:MAG: single-stranded-DNA-specific exonuclease RecJ [bacterium]